MSTTLRDTSQDPAAAAGKSFTRLLTAFVAALLARMRWQIARLLFFACCLAATAACTPEPELAVVVSVRRSVAAPVLATYTRESGAAVGVRYIDPEDAVSDDFDILWSDDPVQPVALARAGKLSPLPAAALHGRPAGTFDPDGLWVGITADVRVIGFDPQRVDRNESPTHFEELLDPRWAPHVILSSPSTRSGAWHAAALFASKGAQPTAEFYRDLKAAGAAFADSERGVLDAITGGGRPIGVLDGELAFAARELGQSIAILIPDQDGSGAVLRATAVALGARAATSARAAALADYLLSAPVGRRLALMASHVALRDDDLPATGGVALRDLVRALPSQAEIARQLDEVRSRLSDLR